MPHFTVVDIDSTQLDAAYPVVRAVAPDITPERWNAYAESVFAQGGMLGLAGAEGVFFGLLSYRRQERLRDGPVLHVDNFVTFELNHSAPGRRRLCQAAEALARKLGCTAVELRLESRGYVDETPARAEGWHSLGHSLDGILLTRRLDAACAAPGSRNHHRIADVGAPA